MTKRLPPGWIVIALVAFALCCLADLAPSSPRQQLPPPSAPPRATPEAMRYRARPATGTAVIRGRVFAADTEEPLRRARITWSSDAPATSAALAERVPVVVTNDNGEYEIRQLSAGRYHVLARRGGYLQMEFAARRATGATRGPVADRDRGVTIDLSEGQSFERADFHLPRAGAIAGRIVDELGDPIAGATVHAARVEVAAGRRRMIPYASDITDDLGEYRLFGLPAGSYYLVASAPAHLRAEGSGLSYPDAYYPGVGRRDQAKVVALSSGQELPEVAFALSPMRLVGIAGFVRTSIGTVPRAGSLAVTYTSDAGVSQTTSYSGLGPDGTFSIRGVVPGEILLAATVAGPRGLDEVAAIPLLVGGDDITGFVVTTGEQGRLSAIVKTDTGGPLPFSDTSTSTPPVRVSAASVEDGMEGAGATTSFTAARRDAPTLTRTFSAAVRPGRRLIGVTGLPAGWGVAAVTSGDRDITGSPVDTQPGTVFSVQVTISNRLPEIGGSAVDRRGRPVGEYSVVLLPRDLKRCFPGSPFVRNERTNQRGEFRLDQVIPGDYNIVAVSIDDDVDLGDSEAFERLRDRSTPITVAFGDKKTLRLVLVSSSNE